MNHCRIGRVEVSAGPLDAVAHQRSRGLAGDLDAVDIVSGSSVATRPVVFHREHDFETEIDHVVQPDPVGVDHARGDLDRGGRRGVERVLDLIDPRRQADGVDAIHRARCRGQRRTPVARRRVVERGVDDFERWPESVGRDRPLPAVVEEHLVLDDQQVVDQGYALAVVVELQRVLAIGDHGVGGQELGRIGGEHETLPGADHRAWSKAEHHAVQAPVGKVDRGTTEVEDLDVFVFTDVGKRVVHQLGDDHLSRERGRPQYQDPETTENTE
jgi:hypothetical protein